MKRVLPFAPILLAALGACGSDDTNLFPSGSASSASSAASSSSGGETSSSSSSGDPPALPPPSWMDCQASDQAFVRRAMLAISGRRTWGQAEVNAYEDILKGVRAADGDTMPPPTDGRDLEHAKKVVVEALMRENAFRERWSDFFMDALHVVRIETKSLKSCYGPVNPGAIDNGALATWVRDNDASKNTPPLPFFNMGQLLSSALALDDLSVVYRAHLFAMLSAPIDGANVSFEAMERIRRQDFGAVFDSAYIHRDVVCLGCHNSEFSVTYHDDPAKNRAWPVPGLFEVALFGASNAKHPGEEATKGADDLRAHSMLRVTDVVGGALRPYGWSNVCGTFSIPQNNDPLNIDIYFGSIRSTPNDPTRGLRGSVWDLESALHRGVDLLAAHGLQRLPGDKLADPDEAFAYLVAENIVEKVWTEVIGTPLTIANYFPRTALQRDILMALTEHFVASHFSLKTLLMDIVAHPVFNLKAPDEGCGGAPYELPNILDPWTISDNDLSKRSNSPADGVFAISSRPLLRSTHRAMEWPYRPDYPATGTEEAFQTAIGHFIKDAAPGYRGLDFQGRLSWEAMYGGCADLSGNDFIDKIKGLAAVTPGATVGDGVIAVKDRLLGDPAVDPAGEQPMLEALLGTPLSSTNLLSLDKQLRSACGVFVSAPQFMLGGIVPKDTRAVPKLTPKDVTYDATCGALALLLAAEYTVTCTSSTTTVVKK